MRIPNPACRSRSQRALPAAFEKTATSSPFVSEPQPLQTAFNRSVAIGGILVRPLSVVSPLNMTTWLVQSTSPNQRQHLAAAHAGVERT